MTVRVTNRTNQALTIDSVVLPPWATQIRPVSTAALEAAAVAKAIDMSHLGNTGRRGMMTECYVATEGGTVQLSDGCEFAAIVPSDLSKLGDPSVDLTAATIRMPQIPYHSQVVSIHFTLFIGALTMTAPVGDSIVNGASVGTYQGWSGYVYVQPLRLWVRIH